ncbi:hypothetical protein Leryth_020142 [Lithospermum erythrorhizon]|nr:hypothetical protein Leryth_020142 [Lithospermum erythrorhizon]
MAKSSISPIFVAVIVCTLLLSPAVLPIDAARLDLRQKLNVPCNCCQDQQPPSGCYCLQVVCPDANKLP